MTAFLDTHVAVFLWEGRLGGFGPDAIALLRSAPLACSPIVRLELIYLAEVGKLSIAPDRILADLVVERGVVIAGDSLIGVVDRAMGLSWTRDPFDRLLVATADLHEAVFISRDRRILAHYPRSVG